MKSSRTQLAWVCESYSIIFAIGAKGLGYRRSCLEPLPRLRQNLTGSNSPRLACEGQALPALRPNGRERECGSWTLTKF